MSDQPFVYSGTELELFEQARNWKKYIARQIAPYLGEKVLEIGAGMGGSTQFLCSPEQKFWLCLEPDAKFAEILKKKCQDHILPSACEVCVGTAGDLPDLKDFDTILFLDVLEHMADDHTAITEAIGRLEPNGHLIVLAPAHNLLFSPFDESIGHYRRYNRQSLLEVVPMTLRLVCGRYLDSVGLFASIANRWILRSSTPTGAQINFWDRAMVPFSKILDPLLGYRIGKSIFMVWKKS